MTREHIIEKLAFEIVSNINGQDINNTIKIVNNIVNMAFDIGKNYEDGTVIVCNDKFGNAEIFQSITEASDVLGIDSFSISEVLNGSKHTVCSYKFKRCKV